MGAKVRRLSRRYEERFFHYQTSSKYAGRSARRPTKRFIVHLRWLHEGWSLTYLPDALGYLGNSPFRCWGDVLLTLLPRVVPGSRDSHVGRRNPGQRIRATSRDLDASTSTAAEIEGSKQQPLRTDGRKPPFERRDRSELRARRCSNYSLNGGIEVISPQRLPSFSRTRLAQDDHP